jgi:transcriptional regulator with XRE-family HTH domain
MPATAPPSTASATHRLRLMGEQLRARRRHLRVGAVAAAEAAGLSRTTLHRIERGEPSVTMAAYLAAAEAVGLEFRLTLGTTEELVPAPGAASAPAPSSPTTAMPAPPQRIRPEDHAQLRQLAWHLARGTVLSPAEALALYERNWRHVDVAAMVDAERALLRALVQASGGGRLLV